MALQNRWTASETADFLDAVGTLGAGAKVYSDGVQYIDDVGFWRWLTNGAVQQPTVNGVPLPLTDAPAIQAWARSFVDSDRARGFQTLVGRRAFEYDFVRANQHDPIELLKGASWRLPTAAEDRMGVDAVRESIFSGSETHQIKTALSESGQRVNLGRYMPGGGQPADVIDVNEGIARWRATEAGQRAILARGDAHPRVNTAISDHDLRVAGQRRIDQAGAGAATPQVTFQGVATQVGRGALVGAVVGVGISTATNYGRYRRGELDGATFGNLMIQDSARGALTGGAMAAVNIPVQLAAHALGVGNPVTIPVMIVVGAALRYVIDPMFGRGEYAESLRDIEVSVDVSQGVASFAARCQAAFEAQRGFVEKTAQLQLRAQALNALAAETDRLLAAAIDDI